MKKILLLLFVQFYFLQAQTKLSLQLDAARFRNGNEKSYVEFYYGFDVTQLTFKKTNNEFKSEAIVTFTVRNEKNDSVAAFNQYRAPFTLSDTAILNTSRSFIDLAGYLLDVGLYRATLKVVDYNDLKKTDSISTIISVERFEQSNFLKLSDLELATSVLQAESSSDERFVKNSYEVKPNPSKVFSKSQPMMFYYVEVYNSLKKKWDTLKIKTSITNSIGNEILTKEQTKNIKSESLVDVGALKVFNLRTGSYLFNYTISDADSKDSVTKSSRFFIYNKDLPSEDVISGKATSVLSSEYAAMTDAECDREYDYLKYIISKTETDKYKKLRSVESKREYLFSYWKDREQRYTGIRTAKAEYFERIAIANNSFKSGFKEGWKSDRGRVFILYGPADEIERHANEVDIKPYEIWYYHGLQGGVNFIFGDRTGFSDYLLLHSTHREELHDENWRSLISK